MASTELNIQVIDNWAPLGLVNSVLAEWPEPNWRHWHSYSDNHAVKRASKDAARLPPAAMLLIGKMAEIDMGEAFPDLELHGAGMHEIPDNGFLSKHLDGARHPQTGWCRVANAILFLNDDFKGGELFFNDTEVVPKKNSLVMFQTSDNAWHGVHPVSGGSRKTLSLFWWSRDVTNSDRTCAEFA